MVRYNLETPCNSLALSPFGAPCCRHHHLVVGLLGVPAHGIKDLARIEQPVRVESFLNTAHHVNRLNTQLFDERFFFAEADSVLALRDAG